MKFIAENLGPIKKVEVDLSKRLILFTGQNNTGKTYLANAVYEEADPILLDILMTNITAFLRANWSTNIDLTSLFDNTKKGERLYSMEYLNNNNIIKNFKSCLIIDEKDKELLKKIIFESYIDKDSSGIYLKGYYNKNKGSMILSISEVALKIITENKIKDNKDPIVDIAFFFEKIIRQLFFKRFFIPAERAGISIFNKELNVIESTYKDIVNYKNITDYKKTEITSKFKFNIEKLKESRSFRYRQSVIGYISFIENLDATRNKKGQYGKLADELENTILKGKVFIDDIGQIKYTDTRMKEAIDLNRASSTVHSLSSLSLYLRYEAKEGDTIMIDEPELNLHLDNQILVARFLGRLVNEGFRVIVSTHSDFIVKEINNLIMMSNEFKDKKEIMKEYGYSDKEIIKPEQVQALLFRYGKDEPENIKITNTGFPVETMNDVIEEIETRTEDLYIRVNSKKMNL